MACCRKISYLNFVLALQFFDKSFRNVLDNLPRSLHVMLLRSRVSVFCFAAGKVCLESLMGTSINIFLTEIPIVSV